MNDQRIPHYEGHPVDAAVVKMSGAIPDDDLDGEVISIDDVVQTITQYRCISVNHKVDTVTGKLVRVQTLRPVAMVLMPFNEADPEDRGIMRSMPQYVNGQVTASRDEDPKEIGAGDGA